MSVFQDYRLNMLLVKKLVLFLPFALVLMTSCNKDNPVPAVAVSIYLPSIEVDAQFNSLRAPYNAIMVTGGYNNNGIVIYRLKVDYAVDDFVAYDRTCPYELDTTKMRWDKKDPMIFKCPRCGTKFNLMGGYLENGPSKFAPRRYTCQFVDGNLSIHN